MTATSHRILVMGVSGSGKSHIGRLVAKYLSIDFIDGDRYHSPGNIEKMARGVPLTDADRQEWLDTLAGLFDEHRRRNESVVIACSALKARYRDILRQGDPALSILYLRGGRKLLLERLSTRQGHFFKGDSMLDSQLADLEPPDDGEALGLDISLPPETIAGEFARWLRRHEMS
ncbi:gluconokinase [Billgrantia montanilacus]|uniref:Gluconokinase n=1 Tax=Billgrantia montanilacus TaxID=2282305 RepID=A0A368TQB2_9GAMM|nr:gluconokinase [Halomonas montanilacus]RCV86791.1 gluconokinase [Halomonas montanilacus]